MLLWASVAGFPIKWEKASGGKSMTWIGATITLSDEDQEVKISIPKEKVAKVQASTRDLIKKPVVGFRQLRSYAGNLSFIAGLIPHLRPFLSTIWAALAGACATNDGAGSSRSAGKLVHTRRVKPALRWIEALVKGEPAPLERVLPALLPTAVAEITTDASPFGMGGVLRVNGELRAAFASDIPKVALDHFKATVGDCKFNTVWEGLALLIAVRLWLPNLGFTARVRCKSDNQGALHMLAKGKARSPDMNVLAREFAIDQALQVYRLSWLKHIPGLTNLEADALSRLHAPIPSAIPSSLDQVEITRVDLGKSFWRINEL